MRPHVGRSNPATAILALVDIRAAIDAFDRGDANVFDVLDSIAVLLEAHRAAARGCPTRRGGPRGSFLESAGGDTYT